MKNTLGDIAAFVAGMIFMYLLVAFVQWEINPANMEAHQRGGTVALGVIVGGFLVGLRSINRTP